MSLILESDIIYNILPHIDLPTIGTLLCISTFVNKLCSDTHFWKGKISNDYKNVIPKSDNWIYEYKCIYKTHIRAIKFVDEFIAYGLSHDYTLKGIGGIILINGSINLDHFRWIPNLPTSKLGSVSTAIYFLINNIKLFRVSFIIYYGDVYHNSYTLDLPRDGLTDYVINLYYNHHNITMKKYKDIGTF